MERITAVVCLNKAVAGIQKASPEDESEGTLNVTLHGRTRHFRTVTFDPQHNAVLLIEQRLLPHEFKIVPANDFRQTARAIKDMVVRGAGAIGATAAYGLAQGARAFRGRAAG